MVDLTEAVPTSLESIRRKVMMAIHSVERETNLFTQRYVKNIGEPERWTETIAQICDKFGKNIDELDDYKDLHQLLNKYRSRRGDTPYPEIPQLRRMIDRARIFEYIAFSLRNDLVKVYNTQLKKYCLSFQPDAKGLDLVAVTEYENKIIAWKKDTKGRMDEMDNMLDECDNYKSPLTEYIGHYRQVMTLMQDICRALKGVCEPMKRWISADATYVRKIQDEINSYNKRKMDVRDIVKHLEFDMEQDGMKLRRRAFFDMKMERALKDLRDEKRTVKRREMEIRENYDKVEAEISRKKRDLEEVRARFSNRKENSPALFNYLSSLIETLRDDIWKLETKQDVLQKQVGTIRRQFNAKQKQVDRLNRDIDESNNGRNKVMDKLDRQDHDLITVRDEVHQVDQKIAVLKRIREIKLHSDTVKKIFHFGYHPGKLEKKDNLETAFKIIATDIGKDWVSLYKELPFKPTREMATKNIDIEVIDRNLRHVRAGRDFSDLAMKSLEKWKRLSTVASLPELLSTLKKMRRKETVIKIQDYMRANSAK